MGAFQACLLCEREVLTARHALQEDLLPVPALLFQGSLLLGGIAKAVLGPGPPGGGPTLIHPFLVSGWCGLVLTALNLLPVGSLDGGRMVQVSARTPGCMLWTAARPYRAIFICCRPQCSRCVLSGAGLPRSGILPSSSGHAGCLSCVCDESQVMMCRQRMGGRHWQQHPSSHMWAWAWASWHRRCRFPLASLSSSARESLCGTSR